MGITDDGVNIDNGENGDDKDDDRKCSESGDDNDDDEDDEDDDDANSKDVASTSLLLPLLNDGWCRIFVSFHATSASEELDLPATTEAKVTLNVVSLFCCPLTLSPEAKSKADELFDSRLKFEGVMTYNDVVSPCRGRDVCSEENTEALSR